MAKQPGLGDETRCQQTLISEKKMSETYTRETALEAFEDWYEKCLESGIEPESIVEEMGEMKLLVNEEQIERYEQAGED